MKKAFFVALIVSIALVLYVGCKKKTESAGVPVTIYRVTFSDNDTDGYVSDGDELIVEFDRHIRLNPVVTDVNSVFELSNAPGDTFGAGPSMGQTSGHAITILLGSGTSLTTSVDGYITSGIRVSESVPFGAIRDDTWLTSMSGGGSYKSIAGRTGFFAPRLMTAVYADEDVSGGLSQGDTITLTWDGDINVYTVWNYWPGRTFILPVDWDQFGSGAFALQTGSAEVTITIGAGAKFLVSGTHAIGQYDVDSPSGIDIAIKMSSALLTYDVGTSDEIVPPSAVDIDVP